MSTVVAVSLRNRSDRPLTILLEPDAIKYSLASNSDCELVVAAPASSPPIVEFRDDFVLVRYHGDADLFQGGRQMQHAE